MLFLHLLILFWHIWFLNPFSLQSNVILLGFLLLFVCDLRDMDNCKCSYYHRCDWFWSAVPGMGHCSVGLGGWAICSHGIFIYHPFHILSSCRFLQVSWFCHRQEKLHLHGCCESPLRWVMFWTFTKMVAYKSLIIFDQSVFLGRVPRETRFQEASDYNFFFLIKKKGMFLHKQSFSTLRFEIQLLKLNTGSTKLLF